MKRELGIAPCGLACCLCSENADCAGCREDGCKDRDGCKNLKCTKERRLRGCWACGDFPCEGGMLVQARIRAFCRAVRAYGEEAVLDALARNEQRGMVYHDPGKLTGDYERLGSEEAILKALGPEA